MMTRPCFELEVMGRKVQLGERTLIMGVLNTTPDSFSDGGLYLAPDAAIARGIEMARAGADWIDVGGESTRPGSHPVSAEEECARVLPVIQGLQQKLRSIPISIDTTKAVVAERAIEAGAAIVNDISGLRFDARIAAVARDAGAPLILMHIRGRPADMQQRPFARSIWRSIEEGLARSIQRALAAGVTRSKLILDPGLGFGKTRAQNFEILAHLERLQRFRLPVLVGSSRKSFVRAIVRGEGLQTPPSRRRNGKSPQQASALPNSSLQFGDAAAVAAAILHGAHVVRVHDVEQIVPAVRIADAITLAARRRNR
ncbi:MAG TPA: dihydropteroate synthase [Terriglobia bacterium]|jgi:dihydropteroate synthase|nr:dihydropteroate synthase [Terriglobia bacterium]